MICFVAPDPTVSAPMSQCLVLSISVIIPSRRQSQIECAFIVGPPSISPPLDELNQVVVVEHQLLASSSTCAACGHRSTLFLRVAPGCYHFLQQPWKCVDMLARSQKCEIRDFHSELCIIVIIVYIYIYIYIYLIHRHKGFPFRIRDFLLPNRCQRPGSACVAAVPRNIIDIIESNIIQYHIL